MSKDVTVAIRDFIALDRRIAQYRKEDIAPTTRRHYDEIWQQFTNFMAPSDVWRATPMDVARWMAEQALRGINPITINRRAAALNYYFEKLGKGITQGRPGVKTRPSPARDAAAQQTLRGTFRKHGRPPLRKLPLLLDHLEQMLDQLRLRSERDPERLFWIRNQAFLVIGWGAALRPGELRMLDLLPRGSGDGWVEIADDGVLVRLRRSKRNTYHRRLETYAIPARPNHPQYCPVIILREWLDASGITGGPLFPSVGQAYAPRRKRLPAIFMRLAIRRCASMIGMNPNLVGGHSLRAGCITWLDQQNVPLERIREHSGHEGVNGVLPYIRRPRSMGDSPLYQTRWIE
jgi:integrase